MQIQLRLATGVLLSLAVTAAAQVPAPPVAAPPNDLPAPTAPAAPAGDAAAPATPAAPAMPPAAPGGQPATTAATTAATQPAPRGLSTTRPATTLSSKIKFTFRDAPVDSVLEYLAGSFGFVVVKDQNVRVTGRITVLSPDLVTADEAIQTLDSVLKNQSPPLAIVRTEKVLRILDRTKAKFLTPVITIHEPEDIAPTDELITGVIPLLTIDAVRVKTDLSAANMFSPDADVSANAASNSLIITDTRANIRRIVEILRSMDEQPGTVTGLKVFKLKFANAAAAAKLITDIFNADTGTTTPGGGGQGNGRGRGGGGGGFGGFGGGRGGFAGFGGGAAAAQGETGTGAHTGKVVASSDDRTNTVVVTGPKDTLEAVAKVIDQLDSDETLDTVFFVRPLKNASAINLQGVLNSMFGASTSGIGGTTSRSTNSFQPLGTTGSTGGGGFGGGGRGGGGGGGIGGGGGLGGGGGGGFGSTASRNTSSTTGRTGVSSGGGISGSRTGASNDLSGQAFVVAEPDTNSLLVTVKSAYETRVRELIDQLDRPVPQVLIKVLVCEVTHTNSSDIGVEYSVLNQHPIDVTNADGTPGQAKGGTTAGTAFGVGSALSALAANGSPSGLAYSVVESHIAAALRALATTGKLDVLSRPSILASDNQLASIMVGQLVPIVTSSNQTTLGNIVNNITYTQVGIILNVTPQINPDGLVTLDVAPTVSEISSQTVTVQAGVAVPVINQRQAQTRVAIRNGQTIIIGGLMQDQKSETVNKIPLLGDIPYLGALFSHTSTSKTKTELLIFLTPQVAQSPELLQAMSNDEKQGTQLVPNAVAPGTFDEHMEGMSRGASKAPMSPPFRVAPATMAPRQPGSAAPGDSDPAPASRPANSEHE